MGKVYLHIWETIKNAQETLNARNKMFWMRSCVNKCFSSHTHIFLWFGDRSEHERETKMLVVQKVFLIVTWIYENYYNIAIEHRPMKYQKFYYEKENKMYKKFSHITNNQGCVVVSLHRTWCHTHTKMF